MGADTIEGKAKEIGGKVRGSIGKITGDTQARIRAKVDEPSDRVRNNIREETNSTTA